MRLSLAEKIKSGPRFLICAEEKVKRIQSILFIPERLSPAFGGVNSAILSVSLIVNSNSSLLLFCTQKL